jgi:excisionase family DNA binding protein
MPDDKSMPNVEKLLYSRKEAAFALGISLSTVDQMIREKKLRVRRVNGRVLVPVIEVRRASRVDYRRSRPSD